MPLRGQSGMQSDYILRLSVRSSICSICYQTGEHNVLKVDEIISMQIGTSGPQSEDVKRSTDCWGQEVNGQGHTLPK